MSNRAVQSPHDRPNLQLVPQPEQQPDDPVTAKVHAKPRSSRTSTARASRPSTLVRLSVVSAVSVLTVCGDVTAEAEMACWQAVRAMIRRRTPYLVVDLEQAIVRSDTFLLLYAMTSFSTRHGLSTVLTTQDAGVRKYLELLVNNQVHFCDNMPDAIAYIHSAMAG